jgi:hypothetical protein
MLEMVGHHRILGLTVDERLYWKEHLKTVQACTNKKLNLPKNLTHKEWVGDQKTLLRVRIHQMVVLSTLRW